jgi:hypothetical protein
MSDEGGSVDDRSPPEVISGLQALLQAIDGGELSYSKGSRTRLQGAVAALERRLYLTAPRGPAADAASTR